MQGPSGGSYINAPRVLTFPSGVAVYMLRLFLKRECACWRTLKILCPFSKWECVFSTTLSLKTVLAKKIKRLLSMWEYAPSRSASFATFEVICVLALTCCFKIGKTTKACTYHAVARGRLKNITLSQWLALPILS